MSDDTRYGFLPQADARAYGMTTALRRGFNGKAPRTRYSNPAMRQGTSPNVLVTYADGREEIRTAGSFRNTAATTRTRTQQNQQNERQSHYKNGTIGTGIERRTAADMPAIGNVD